MGRTARVVVMLLLLLLLLLFCLCSSIMYKGKNISFFLSFVKIFFKLKGRT